MSEHPNLTALPMGFWNEFKDFNRRVDANARFKLKYGSLCQVIAVMECGAWLHAVISSLGARAKGGGGRAPAFRVARCQTPLGTLGSQEGTSGFHKVPFGFVYQSHTHTGQSRDPSRPVDSHRAKSGSR